MATSLRIQVVVPSPARRTEPRAPVPGVTVEAGPVPPDRTLEQPGSNPASATQKGSLDPDAPLTAVTREPDGSFLAPVPEDGQLLVRLGRPGALSIQVALDLRPGRARFVHGQPRTMTLGRRTARVGGRSVTEPVLVMEWGEPAEVVAASGHDGMFHFAPGMRLDKRIKTAHHRLAPWTVLTQFRFDKTEKNERRGTPEVRQLRVDRLLVQASAPKGVLLTSRPILEEDAKTALTFYRYLAQVGAERPGSVHEVGFFNHAWWGGPVFINTARFREDCSALCPIDREHDSEHVDVPRELLRWDRGPFEDEPELVDDETGQEHPLATRIGFRVPVYTLPPGRTGHRRSRDIDRDPRNTDFTSKDVLAHEGIDLAAMRAALAPLAVVRVWGCNNGPMGERFRTGAKLDKALRGDGQNVLLSVKTAYLPSHGDHYSQSWLVRRGDLQLGYVSVLRRCFAQAIAAGLERPCYASIPGSWGWFEKKHLEGGMNVQEGHHGQVVGFARRAGLLDTPEDPEHPSPSPGLYHRFDAAPPKIRVPLTVLVTGFVPFRGSKSKFPSRNTASEVVGRLVRDAVLARVVVPPWVDLDLTLVAKNDVDVVWTNDAARTQLAPPGADRPAASIKGSQGILELARQVDASIVVIVGESASLSATPIDLRIEGYARNVGKGMDEAPKLVDNAGQALVATGPIFLDAKQQPRASRFRTSVPLRAWASAMAAVRRAGLTPEPFEFWTQLGGTKVLTDIGTSTGDYICNESYYRLLLDSYGTTDKGTDGSGRWVSMIHLPAFDFSRARATGGGFEAAQLPESRLASSTKALEVTLASFVESMLWAVDIPGRKRKLLKKAH